LYNESVVHQVSLKSVGHKNVYKIQIVAFNIVKTSNLLYIWTLFRTTSVSYNESD